MINTDCVKFQIRYSFNDAVCGVDCDDFIIDSVTGLITAALNDYDRQTKPSYVLRVLATDQAPSAIPNSATPNNTGY